MGDPLSWRHYQYGLSWLGRQWLRGQQQTAEAVRIAGATQDAFRDWHRDLSRQVMPRG